MNTLKHAAIAAGMLAAAGQLGEVRVITISTSPLLNTFTSYISPRSYTFTGISGSNTVFSTSITASLVCSSLIKRLTEGEFRVYLNKNEMGQHFRLLLTVTFGIVGIQALSACC